MRVGKRLDDRFVSDRNVMLPNSKDQIEFNIGRTSGLGIWDIASLVLILACTTVTLAFAWNGFLGGDDKWYAQAAMNWLERFPYIGSDHRTLRHPLVVPIALSFRIFGISEFNLILPTIIYFYGLIIITYIAVSMYCNKRLAIIFSVLLVLTPLFPLTATTASVDIVELFYVCVSFWLFFIATRTSRPLSWLLGSGVAAGFAWMTRETTAGLILFYGLLFLIGFGVKRQLYWVMALGFWLVIMMELAFLTVVTGDPLYRIKVDFFVGAFERPSWSGSILDSAGNLVLTPWLDPFLLLAANQEFALLYFVAVPAGIWLCLSKRVDREAQRLARLSGWLAIAWFVFISANSGALFLLPRYMSVTTYAAVMLVAIWIHQMIEHGHMRRAVLFTIALVTINLLGIYVDNKDYFFPERTLVKLAGKAHESIYTDPFTAYRANFLLRAQRVRDRVIAEPPPEGALFLHVPRNVTRGREGNIRFDPADYTPSSSWSEELRADPGRKLIGVVIELLHLERFIPGEILRRLDRPEPPVLAYRIGPEYSD